LNGIGSAVWTQGNGVNISSSSFQNYTATSGGKQRKILLNEEEQKSKK
jgi:hypothetical protein